MARKKQEEKVSRRGSVGLVGQDLASKRAVRRREPGDGKGMDVSIAPGAFVALEKQIAGLNAETRKRMLAHVSHHVEQALKPLVKLAARSGTQNDVNLVQDVGPNMLRTVIEMLEDDRKN